MFAMPFPRKAWLPAKQNLAITLSGDMLSSIFSEHFLLDSIANNATYRAHAPRQDLIDGKQANLLLRARVVGEVMFLNRHDFMPFGFMQLGRTHVPSLPPSQMYAYGVTLLVIT